MTRAGVAVVGITLLGEAVVTVVEDDEGGDGHGRWWGGDWGRWRPWLGPWWRSRGMVPVAEGWWVLTVGIGQTNFGQTFAMSIQILVGQICPTNLLFYLLVGLRPFFLKKFNFLLPGFETQNQLTTQVFNTKIVDYPFLFDNKTNYLAFNTKSMDYPIVFTNINFFKNFYECNYMSFNPV